MAKDKKKVKDTEAKADKGKKAEKAEKAAEFKYGVSDVAEALGIKEASVRVQLRNKGVEKAGKSYGWNTQAELKEVVAQLKADDGEKGSKKSSSKKSKDEPAADEGKAKSKKDKGGKKDKGKKSKD